MWPFRKNKKPVASGHAKDFMKTMVDDARKDWSDDWALVDRFAEWKPSGSELVYLGVKMLVVGHQEIHMSGMSVWVEPCLKCRYADSGGKIHAIKFCAGEVLEMMARDALREPRAGKETNEHGEPLR